MNRHLPYKKQLNPKYLLWQQFHANTNASNSTIIPLFLQFLLTYVNDYTQYNLQGCQVIVTVTLIAVILRVTRTLTLIPLH